MDRKEQAVMLHKNGFNCAQAVACSFCHVMGADPITTFRLAEPLGYGMGQMGTCGAVSAMALVTGMKMSISATGTTWLISFQSMFFRPPIISTPT